MKERPLLDKPKHAPGAGGGYKLVDYGLDVPRTKESRQAAKEQEHEALLRKVADLEANIDQRVEAAVQSRVEAAVATKIDDEVASRVNSLVPSFVESIKQYFKDGQEGPLPLINLGGSTSDNLPPTTGAQGAPILVTPPVGNAGPREHSPAAGGASSPSINCTPDLGPSTRAELDALEVIN